MANAAKRRRFVSSKQPTGKYAYKGKLYVKDLKELQNQRRKAINELHELIKENRIDRQKALHDIKLLMEAIKIGELKLKKAK